MRKLFMIIAAMFATSAMAQEVPAPALVVTGGIGVDVAENAAGDYAAETTLDFGLEVAAYGAFADFTLQSLDGGTVTVDAWKLGTTVSGVTLSYGDQGDLMVGNDFEVVGGTTLADPAEFDSLMVSVGDASVMVALTDATSDITDVQSVQGAYTVNAGALAITAVGDYNLDSEEYILGGKASMNVSVLTLGGIVTYESASEAIGYEASAGYGFLTAFANGDDTDALQNVGAGATYKLNGLNLYAEGSYNIDREEFTPAAGVSFSF